MACKADPKRRRKKRIGKTGRELVFEITSLHLPPSRVGLLRRHRPERQCNTSNVHFLSPPLFLPGSFCQWPRDEPRTQTEEGWKWHQYVRRLTRTAHSSAHRHAALNCQPLFPRFFQKQRKPFLRLAALSRERERQTLQIVQQREGRGAEARAHLLRGQKGHPPPPLVAKRSIPVAPPADLNPISSLLQESRHEKEKSEKKEKRDSTGGKEEKKQYPWMEPKIRILLTFPSSLHFN